MVVRAQSGGGGMQETDLWTNSNPSSAMGSSQSPTTQISLSKSYDNFDMLRIYYYKSTTDRTVSYIQDIDASVLDTGGMVRYVFGVTTRVRFVMSPNAAHTTVAIGRAYGVNESLSSYTDVIPYKICGIKY